MKFIKIFIRHNYLGNIYCMSTEEYINYILQCEKKYVEFKNTNFINIMKQFVEYSDNLKKMFEIIFILLLSDDDDINDIAGLLIGLTQEKRITFTIFYMKI